MRLFARSVALFTLLTAGVHAFGLTYSVQSLGTLGGQYSYSDAINNNGAVAGHSVTSEGIPEAFFYVDQTMRTLGPPTYKAHGINDMLQISGVASTQDGTRAFLRTNDQTVILGTLAPPSRLGRSWALGIRATLIKSTHA